MQNKSGFQVASNIINYIKNNKKATIALICAAAVIMTSCFVFARKPVYFESDETIYLEEPIVLSENKAVANAELKNAFGVYINDELVAAVEEASDLDTVFVEILNDAAKDYENAEAKFTSTPKTLKGLYDAEYICSLKQLKNKIVENYSDFIEVKSVITEEVTVPYRVETKYDSSKDDDYYMVKQKGKDGLNKVTTETVYVNGKKQSTSVVETVAEKEPVNKIVVTGKTLKSGVGSGTFAWPSAYTYNIYSGFGYREDGYHGGIDINANGMYGSDILAADSGTVITASFDEYGYGHHVEIDHGNGYVTRYAHCSDIYVTVGEKVAKGTVIAAVGSTGNSEAPHLHFEIIENGVRVDPTYFF